MTSIKKRLGAALVLSSAAALALAGCSSASGTSGSGGGKVKLSLVAYSTPQAAYEKIIKAFQATPEGKNVEFDQSYGASGDQSRAVVAGLPADVVEFSLAPDMDRLVKANLVDANWTQGSYGPNVSVSAAAQYAGNVTDSVVVIATRKGDPKGIKDWPDLIKSGVKVITPNPFTSGGARWNVMAAYGGVLAEGSNDAQAKAYLTSLFKHVPVQDDSARKSLQTFVGGAGDAMLAYENDAIFAQQNNQALDYTVPDDTILIENPVAVTSNTKHPKEAQAFVNFLYSDAAQKIFSDNGYRPVVSADATRTFPQPSGLFKITKFGGWSKVTKEFFDPDTGFLLAIERGLGVPTKK